MSYKIALPEPLLYEIESLGLCLDDKVAFFEQLADRLDSFPASYDATVVQSYQFVLGSCQVFCSIGAKLIDQDLLITFWDFEALPYSDP